MNLELKESDILWSVFAAGLQSIVMGTGVRVSCVMSHQPVSYSVPVSVSHTSAVASHQDQRDTRAQNIMEYVVTISSVFSQQRLWCWCRLVEGGGKNWRGHSKHYTTLHNITQQTLHNTIQSSSTNTDTLTCTAATFPRNHFITMKIIPIFL